MQHEYISQQLSTLCDGQISETVALNDRVDRLSSLPRQRLSSIRNPVYQAGLSHLLNGAIKHRSLEDAGSNVSQLALTPPSGAGTPEQVDSCINRYEAHTPLVSTVRTTIFGKRSRQTTSFSNWSSIFGTVTTTKTRRSPKEDEDTEPDESFNTFDEDTQTSILIRPSPWLVSIGLSYEAHISVSRSLNSWRLMQQTWRIIPSSSSIFHACREGDLKTVKGLLSRREASVWDVDEIGKTPLHVRSSAKFRSLSPTSCFKPLTRSSTPRKNIGLRFASYS